MMLTACPIINTGSAAANAAPVSAITQATKDIQAQAPIQYRIQARLDEKKMTIEGSESITYRNTSKDTLKQLVFHTYADANLSESTQTTMFKHSNEEISKNNPDKKPEDFLGGIDIEKVTTGGQALDFSNKDQAMSVKLEQPLQPGESVSVQVHFNLKIPYGSQRLSYYKDIINGAHWFPVMSVYDEAKHEWDSKPYSKTFETDYYTSADYEVQFNVPDQYQVVMPGTITTRDDAETGRKVVSTVAENTREFAFFASPNFKVDSVTRNGLTVEYYYFDNQPGKKKIVDGYVDQAFKAIDFFSDKYGKYPYPEFRIVESYVEGVAIEYSRLIQMGQIGINSAPEQDTVFVHEIAHQWFHALIGNNSETESFLDEGFADFSKVYFSEKQGDTMNGFKSIQFDDSTVDKAIASTNDEVGDWASPVYYDKGRQAIYQLYRSVGEEKFDAFMKEYFKRYVYQNATIDGLLQTIEDVLGKEVRNDMKTALYEPNFALKPEYQLSNEERTAYLHDQFQSLYETALTQVPNVPFETMSRVMDKALQGEPLAIVVSDQVSKAANKQQEAMVNQLTTLLDLTGVKYDLIQDRQELKRKMKKELATSNLIVLGKAKSNGFVQALKSSIIDRATHIGFQWKTTMNQPSAAGAYVIKHPYNQNRLMLHYFWNEDHLNGGNLESFMMKMQESIGFSSAYYQYYVLDKTGKVTLDKKVENPLSKLFADE
ncbi:M1 family metallopeptidase [Paenibacillus pabuli]|uniref:Peptidase M1-like protein n=2 Tax=Paenibacillus TaxID=44249 RepID=A0A855YAP9_9BACL|nr:M1 family metallopeptidase [Paenibacillus pabuli]PWW38705.1 peptidase M1-like protein [Paenibacillus pabuli]PXW05890.1 peptidase M1-like protein [Paenibacillus taichungensis]